MKRLAASGIAAVTIASLAWVGLLGHVFAGFQTQATDALFPTGPTDRRIVVVKVDEASIAAVGKPWPWPRRVHADLVRKLNKAGVATIVYDVVFDPATKDDAELASALRSTDAVLAAQTDASRVAATTLPIARAVTPPVGVLQRAAAAVGHANVTQDADGIVRSAPLLVEDTSGRRLPSLALAAFVASEHLSSVFTVRPDGIQVGDRLIPTDDHGLMDINYSGGLQPDAAGSSVSAADVLAGRVPRGKLSGKIALIGATDPGLGDTRLTPSAKTGGMPGVFVQADALNTMLTRTFVGHPSHTSTVLLCFLIALVIGALVALTPLPVSVPASLVVLVAYVVTALARFDSGRPMDLVYPPLAGALSFVAALAVRYLTESRERRRVSSLFAQYVPDSVAEQLIRNQDLDAVLDGQLLEVTVLFCDLRNYTATAAGLQPTQVRELLNEYYDDTTDVVLTHGGTLMQYVGDEVFAVFGAPIADTDSARSALRCAQDMQAVAGAINARLEQRGLPTIAYGIGLHTGDVVAAHLGSRVRKQYSVMGDTVNCGARLCSLAGPGGIVVSEVTYERVGAPAGAELLPTIELKGVGRDLRPYRLNAQALEARPS